MKKFMEEFKAFALRGNVMDMAVGVIIGGAFSGIVTSLTDRRHKSARPGRISYVPISDEDLAPYEPPVRKKYKGLKITGNRLLRAWHLEPLPMLSVLQRQWSWVK